VLVTAAAAVLLGATGYAAAGGAVNASLLDTTGTTSTDVSSTTATETVTETTPTTAPATSPTTTASSPTTTATTPKKTPVKPAVAPVAASSASFPVWATVGFAVAGALILSGLGGFLYTRTRR
jgi:cell division protein FtsN